MATVALAAGDQNIANNVTYASSALAGVVRMFLAADFTEDSVVRIESTGTGSIVVLDSLGRRLGTVLSHQTALVSLRLVTDGWHFFTQQTDPVAFPTAVPAGGVGAAAGGWDTAGNRDTAITCLQALRAEAIKRGWFKAE